MMDNPASHALAIYQGLICDSSSHLLEDIAKQRVINLGGVISSVQANSEVMRFVGPTHY